MSLKSNRLLLAGLLISFGLVSVPSFPLPNLPAGKKFKLVESQSSRIAVNNWLWQKNENKQLFPFLEQRAEVVLFKDEAGTVVSEHAYLPNSEIPVSPAQKYLALKKLVKTENSHSEKRVIEYHIFNSNGEKQYRLARPIIADEPIPGCYLFDNGGALLADAPAGQLEFFDPSGEKQKVISLFGDNLYNYEKPMSISIAGQTNAIAVVTQKSPATINPETGEVESGQPFLIYLTRAGKENWRKALPEEHAGQVSISPNGHFCAVSQYSTLGPQTPVLVTEIYDSGGNPLMSFNSLFKQALFSNDSRYLALVEQDEWRLIDLVKQVEICHHYLAASEQRMIIDLHFHPAQNILALVTGVSRWKENQFLYQQPQVLLYDLKGSLKGKQSFEQDIVNPSFIFSDSDLKFGIGFQHSFQTYEVKREIDSQK